MVRRVAREGLVSGPGPAISTLREAACISILREAACIFYTNVNINVNSLWSNYLDPRPFFLPASLSGKGHVPSTRLIPQRGGREEFLSWSK